MKKDLTSAIYRFLFALPARKQDVAAMRDAFPEFFESGSRQEIVRSLVEREAPFLPIRGFLLHEEMIHALTRWLETDEATHPRPLGSGEGTASGCPLSLEICPRSSHGSDVVPSRRSEPPSSDSPEEGQHQDASAEGLLKFLTLGGGVAEPAGSHFLRLARKARRSLGPIKDVIVTDKYVRTSMAEDGTDGAGFDWLMKLLSEGLHLSKRDDFRLLLSPSLKTDTTLQRLTESVEKRFPQCRVRQFSVKKGHVHDRFYVFRDTTATLKGIFGPSLNSLDGRGLFLMGDLEGDILGHLDQMLQMP